MFKPMLAKVFEKHSHKLVYPVLVQPKLNGIRMTWSDDKARSRSGKPLQLPKAMLDELCHFHIHENLDGELYKHGVALEKIYGNAKRLVTLTQDVDLQFHVFDIFSEETHTDIRLDALEKLRFGPTIRHVKALTAHSKTEVQKHLRLYLSQGYEGAIIRTPYDFYVQGRTDALLKLKPWIFVTAKIIGFTEGTGKYKGMLGSFTVRHKDWICNVGTGFDDTQRRVYWKHRNFIMQHPIKMKYTEKTGKGNPRSPVFLKGPKIV